MALPRRYRIALTKNYLTLLRKDGKRIETGALRAFYIKKSNVENSRFAVIAGASLAKKAVVRNRMRRVIQEAMLENLPTTLRVDMIVYPKRTLVELDKGGVEREVVLLFKKMRSPEND